MKKATLLTLIFVFVLSGIGMARDDGFGSKGPGHGKGNMGIPHGKWWKVPKVADKLALTLEEKEKLNSMHLEHRRKMIDLRSQVAKERLEMEEILDSSAFTAAAGMDRFKKLKEAHTMLAIERFRFLAQVRELLGLERFQELKYEVKKRRMKKYKKRYSAEGYMPAE